MSKPKVETQTGEVFPSLERLSPAAIVWQPRQYLNGIDTGRLYQKETFNREKVIQSMLPNSISGTTRDGRLLRFVYSHSEGGMIAIDESGNHQWACPVTVPDQIKQPSHPNNPTNGLNPSFSQELQTCHTVACSPWGDQELMFLDFGLNARQSLVDIRYESSHQTMIFTGRLLDFLLKDNPYAYFGVNNSYACAEGRGLMSVLWVHHKVWTWNDLPDLTPEKIIHSRSHSLWDEGLSRITGQKIAHVLNACTLPGYWAMGKANEDSLGLTIHMPHFQPQDLTNPHFIDHFWRPLSHIIHHHLKELHGLLFDSNLDEVIECVRRGHFTGQLDLREYQNYFRLRQGQSDQPEYQLLQQLHQRDEIRKGFGWTSGIQFSQTGALVTVSFGFGNWDMGPVESLGIQLKRPADPVSDVEMAHREKFYSQLVEKWLR